MKSRVGIFFLFFCVAAQAEPPIVNFPGIDVDVFADLRVFTEAVARDEEFDIWLEKFGGSRTRNGAPRLFMGHGGAPTLDHADNVDLNRFLHWRAWKPKGSTFIYSVKYATLPDISSTFRQNLGPRDMGVAFWCNSQYQAAAVTANTGRPTIAVKGIIEPGHLFEGAPSRYQAGQFQLNLLDRKKGLVTLNIPENQNRNAVLSDRVYIPMSEVDRVFGPAPSGGSSWKDKATGGARGLRDWLIPGAAEAAAARQAWQQMGGRVGLRVAAANLKPVAAGTASAATTGAVLVGGAVVAVAGVKVLDENLPGGDDTVRTGINGLGSGIGKIVTLDAAPLANSESWKRTGKIFWYKTVLGAPERFMNGLERIGAGLGLGGN